MNILYILGNGFDLAQGLETKYTDFLHDFLDLAPHNENKYIQEFRQEVTDEFEKWADLESHLGVWLDGKVDAERANETFDFLVESMATYMRYEQDRVPFDLKVRDKLLHNMVNVASLMERVQDSNDLLQYFKNYFNSSPHSLNVITLNYTNTYEKLAFKEGEDKTYVQSDYNLKFEVTQPIHLHGTVDEGIVLGLNDESQIKDKNILKDDSVSDRFIKSRALENIYRNDRERLVNNAITNANLICIYGTAFGPTDKRIWKKVMARANEGCRVILFHYNSENFSNVQAYKKRDKIRELNRMFVENSGSGGNQNPVVVPSSILGEYNSHIFDLGLTVKASRRERFNPFKGITR